GVEQAVGLRRERWKDEVTSALRRKRFGGNNRAISILAAHPDGRRPASITRVNKHVPMQRPGGHAGRHFGRDDAFDRSVAQGGRYDHVIGSGLSEKQPPSVRGERRLGL